MTYSPDVNQQSAYAPPPAGPAGPKVSATWTGVLMALGAIVAIVGTFLPYEKIILFQNGSAISTFTFSGVGAKSSTGQPISGLTPGNAGKIVLVLSVLLLVAGLLVLAKKGRLWLAIVSLVFAAFALVMCLASLAAPKSDAKDLNASADPGYSANALNKLGIDVATAGVAIALLAVVLALFVRRRRNA